MKLRLLLMGGIIAILALALMVTKGVQSGLLLLLGIGVVLLIVGTLWTSRRS